MRRPRILSQYGSIILTLAVCAALAPVSQASINRTGHTNAGLVDDPLLVLPALLNPRRWASARCNDGTPFGFILEPSPTNSKDWVIYLQGGGFCDDNASMCSGRSEEMSSTPGQKALEEWERIRGRAIFSQNPDWNPSFYSANRVFAFYCSSDVWSGGTIERRPTSADPIGWFFSGRANVRAMLEVLTQFYGLSAASPETRVIYAGGSAGGTGVQATADIVQQQLRAIAVDGRLKLLNDAGPVFEFDHPDYRFADTGQTFTEVMDQAYGFWGSSLNPRCEAAMKRLEASPGTCFDQVVVYPFLVDAPPYGLGLPLFVQYSSIDGFQLRAHGIEGPEGIAVFRSNTLEQFGRVSWTWLFSGGSFPYHVASIKNEWWVMGPPGSGFRDVLTRFWEDELPEVIIYGNP